MSPEPFDHNAVEQRLEALTDVRYEIREALPASTGHSNTTWLIRAKPRDLVIKVQTEPNVVYACHPYLEPSVMQVVGGKGAPVPEIITQDADNELFGAPWFAMERIESRSIPDDALSGYLNQGWFREAPDETRNSIWRSFVAALGKTHGVPVLRGDRGNRGGSHKQVIDYLRAAVNELGTGKVSRTLALLDAFERSAPHDVDEDHAYCMGDARLANALVDEAEVVGLVDWEIAYVGNPRADVGYVISHDRFLRESNGAKQLGGLMSAEETWDLWQRLTDRRVSARDRRYWEAFSMSIMVVTANRAILQMMNQGLMEPRSPEDLNPFLPWVEKQTDRID